MRGSNEPLIFVIYSSLFVEPEVFVVIAGTTLDTQLAEEGHLLGIAYLYSIALDYESLRVTVLHELLCYTLCGWADNAILDPLDLVHQLGSPATLHMFEWSI